MTFAPRKEATRPNAHADLRGPETLMELFGTDRVAERHLEGS